MGTLVSSTTRANYGLDAPGIVRTMGSVGGAALLVCIVTTTISQLHRLAGFGSAMCWMGASLMATALLMIASSRWGKLRARDALLDRLEFTGTETLLDIGCGHGLMLLGGARRLPHGRAIGIDLWSQVDQHANSAQATLANAVAEGVSDRVEVRDGDMRSLPLEPASVDVIVSSLAIHNLSSAKDRDLALREMVRVLRPGGRIAILDIAHVGAYASTLERLGCTIDRMSVSPWIFPPTRELVATLGER